MESTISTERKCWPSEVSIRRRAFLRYPDIVSYIGVIVRMEFISDFRPVLPIHGRGLAGPQRGLWGPQLEDRRQCQEIIESLELRPRHVNVNVCYSVNSIVF